MIKKAVIIGLIFLLIMGLSGCKQKKETEKVKIENPFIGGTTGIIASFENLRPDVRDQGQDPFDIIIKLDNKGETDIAPQNIQVKLSGINPIEFGTTQANLIKNAQEESIAQKKTPEGTITPSPPTFVEFLGLNYQQKITGTQITFPLKVDVCYAYKTRAVGKLCIRSNTLKQEEGVCQVTGEKPIYTSGAPVQIVNLKESARAKNKIGFTFEVINSGGGSIYKKGLKCDKSKRQNENRVTIRVETNMPGLKCVGLTEKSPGIVEGETTLYAGSKLVSCSQTTPINDFEQVIKITAEYDYETSITDKITVKSSELI